MTTMPGKRKPKPPLDMSSRLTLSLAELSSATDLSVRTLRRKIESGKLRASRIGQRILVRVDEVNRFLDKNQMRCN